MAFRWPSLLPMILVFGFTSPGRAQAPQAAAAPAGPITLKAIPSPLVWRNVPMAFKVLGDASLAITAIKGTDLYSDPTSQDRMNSAPMLMFEPGENFVLTAALTVDLKQEFDGGFLVVYADADRWAKLLFEKSHYGPASVCSAVTNGVSDDTVNSDIDGNKVFLRVARMGEAFAFYFSKDGKTWRYLRLFRFPGKGRIQVGFGSQSPLGASCASTFEQIRYTAKAPADFWSGE